MSGGGGGGTGWIKILIVGVIVTGIAVGMGHSTGPGWLQPALLAIGGLLVIFGSCESMIVAVEGLGKRLKWNHFVAGTMAGLASNIPEVVMIGFVVAKNPRVAFVVVCLTIHVGALAFGVYSSLLPRDKRGQARLPLPLVHLSTDLYACAAGVFFALGALMIVLKAFDAGDARGEGLLSGDLVALACGLLLVQVVNIVQLLKNFSKTPGDVEGATPDAKQADAKEADAKAEPDAKEADAKAEPDAKESDAKAADAKAADAKAADATPKPEIEADDEIPGWGNIAAFGLLGIAMSVVGGHAVGEFAESLVHALTSRGYSEMIGAIILAVFASAGVFIMIASAHVKGMYEIAIANVSGAITQQPFLVLPITLLLMAIFASTGIIPTLEHGGVLAIDFETTSVVIFGFPAFLILWKSVQDDGKVNWLETASMIAVFMIVIFFLAEHGTPTIPGAEATGH
jgi:hypothetical protein